jgi:hypothetical protein
MFLVPVSASAAPTLAKGVAVECAPLKAVRLLPADEEKQGRHYTPLSDRDLAAVKQIASAIFASPTTDISIVPAAYFGEPDANGDHWKKEGEWPGPELRALTGECVVSSPQSLGRQGGTSYAFVPVSCPSGKSPWTAIHLGVQLQNGKVTSYCANVGAFTTVVLSAGDRG